MAFNHYAKIAKIYLNTPNCRIIKINKPTKTKRFDGSYNFYTHYYRLVDQDGNNIKYGKFQQLDLFAKYLKIPIELLEIEVQE